LQNVRREVQGMPEMDRSQKREHRRAVLQDATAVYQGQDEAAIHRRLADFRATWGTREPKPVATLEREADHTWVYLRVQEQARQRGEIWKTEALRTTSNLERVQRHFRQKARQVVIFHAAAGVDAVIYLVICHHDLACPSTQPWVERLEEALLAA
jgi:transposase-like protein